MQDLYRDGLIKAIGIANPPAAAEGQARMTIQHALKRPDIGF
jgi:hypothetical protein